MSTDPSGTSTEPGEATPHVVVAVPAEVAPVVEALARRELSLVNLTDGSRNLVLVLALLSFLLSVLAIADAVVQVDTGHADPTITLIFRFLVGLTTLAGAGTITKIFRRGGLG